MATAAPAPVMPRVLAGALVQAKVFAHQEKMTVKLATAWAPKTVAAMPVVVGIAGALVPPSVLQDKAKPKAATQALGQVVENENAPVMAVVNGELGALAWQLVRTSTLLILFCQHVMTIQPMV